MEKKRAHEKLWTKIKTSDGNYKEDISSILEEQIKYYQNLFTSEYLTSNLETKVNETDKEMCDKEVSIDEILNAAKLQKPDKSRETMEYQVSSINYFDTLLETILYLW